MSITINTILYGKMTNLYILSYLSYNYYNNNNGNFIEISFLPKYTIVNLTIKLGNLQLAT